MSEVRIWTVEQAHFNFEDNDLIVLKYEHDAKVKELEAYIYIKDERYAELSGMYEATSEEVDELESELTTIKAELENYRKAKAENDERFQLEIGSLKAQNEKLLKCVEFYADENNWKLTEYGECQMLRISDGSKVNGNAWKNEVGGKLARQTIKDIKGSGSVEVEFKGGCLQELRDKATESFYDLKSREQNINPTTKKEE
jgi:hypothetical protein